MAGANQGGTTQTSTNLPKWLQPYAKNFIEQYSKQVYDENGNVVQQPGDLNQQLAGFNPTQQQAMQNLGGITDAEQQIANLGGGLSAATMGGQFLYPGANPFLDATYNAAAKNLVQQYQTGIAPSTMAAAQRAGQFGSSAMNEQMALDQYGLGENLQNLAANVYGTNYSNERQNQLQTLGQLPNTLQAMNAPQTTMLGIGALQQQQEQSGYDTSYLNAVNKFQFPFEVLSGMGGALGQAGSGAGTSRTTVDQGGK